MNVAIIMPYTKHPKWGVENVAFNLVEGFKKNHILLKENHIKIYVISNKGRTKNLTIKKDEKYPNINYIFFDNIKFSTFFGDFQNIIISKEISESLDFDIIHNHDWDFILPSLVFFKKSHLIFNFHGLPWVEFKFDKSALGKIGDIQRCIKSKLLSKHYDNMISISPYVKSELIDHLYISENKVDVIGDPISDEFFDIEKKEENHLIFYPAQICHRKNQLTLVKAASILCDKIKDFKIILTGKIKNNRYANKVTNYVKKQGLSNHIKFAGLVPQEILHDYYSKSKIVVIPSLYETFSLIAIEAMATGTPIVASNVGILPEALTHGENGYFIDPKNAKDIAEKLQTLLRDDKLQKKMGENSKHRAMNWKSENIVKELIKLYKKIYRK